MRFKVNADMEFEADDIEAALAALEDYFACAVSGEKHELEYMGEIKIEPVDTLAYEIIDGKIVG